MRKLCYFRNARAFISQYVLLNTLAFNPNLAGEGQICPMNFQILIPLELKVGLTANLAVKLNLSIVLRSIKKLTNSYHQRTLPGPFSVRVPPNEKKYCSRTKVWIYLKPGCIFKFVHCLKVYKKMTNLDHQSNLAGLFCETVPSKEPLFYRQTKMK